MTKDQLYQELQAAIRAHYIAANPSEATMRREVYPDQLERRQARVRRLQKNVELAARNYRDCPF